MLSRVLCRACGTTSNLALIALCKAGQPFGSAEAHSEQAGQMGMVSVGSHALATNIALDWRYPRGHHFFAATRGDSDAQTIESHALASREDHYDGIIIDAEHLPSSATEFSEQLAESLNVWRARKKRGIWLRLDLSRAGLVQAAVELGFDFCHAEQGHVVLTKWLPLDAPNKLPEGATHQVGVGAFVLNVKREVLLVQERHGIHRDQGIWKLPTGLSNLGEDIPAAAERELFEEAGLTAHFDKIIAVRQSHGHNLGRSDLFFVCGLRLGTESQDITVQNEELAAAAWHPLNQAGEMPIFQSSPMFKAIFERCRAYADGSYKGIEGLKLAAGFNARIDLLMHG